MAPLGEIWRRLVFLFRKRQFDSDLDEEMQFHLAMRARRKHEEGMEAAEANYQARRQFGNRTLLRELSAEAWGWRIIEDFVRDLRLAFRTLAKNRGFTAIAIITLALGIGANTVIFSAINGILIEHLPYGHASRLLTIQREQIAWGITSAEVHAIQKQCPAFERLAIVNRMGPAVTIGDGLPTRRESAYVSGDFFPMLGVGPLLGRYIVPADTQSGAPPVAVLSHSLWEDGFGQDSRVVGRDIVLGKIRYSVIGVMPERFGLGVEWGSFKKGLWMPLVDSRPNRRSNLVVGLVKTGVPLSAAKAQINAISPRLAERFPKNAEHVALAADTPKLSIEQDVRRGLLILQVAVALVLLLASVNLSALLIARAWSRHRELAIRKAVGASRLRIVRQLLTESLALTLSGGALGLLLAYWGIPILRTIAPQGTPRLDRIQLDPNVLWFTFTVSVLSAILIGLLPALHVSGGRVGNSPEGRLRARFASPGAHQRRFSRNCLLIVEIGLAVVLVIGGALMVRSFDKLTRIDPGVRPDHVLTMQVELSDSSCLPTCESTTQNVLDGISSLPGVERAALSNGGPMGGGLDYRSGIMFEDSQGELPSNPVENGATPDFFQAAGIRLLRGRGFVDRDRADVAVISEGFSRKYLTGDPLGRRFSTHKDGSGHPIWMEIVGVVNDTRDRAVTQFNSGPTYYTPFVFGSHYYQVIVRTSGDPMSMASPIERVIRSADKAAIVTDVKSLERVLYDSAALPRFHTTLFGMFGLLALLLALIGIYGVTSYSVLQRAREIAVRMALGARAEDVRRRIVVEGGVLALGGIALGLAVALVLARSLQHMLYEIRPVDSATFIGVATLILSAVLAACYLPARAATRVDPITILRHE